MSYYIIIDVSGYLNCITPRKRTKNCFLKDLSYLDLANVETHNDDPGKITCQGILNMDTVPEIEDVHSWLESVTAKIIKSENTMEVHHKCCSIYGKAMSFAACQRALNARFDVNEDHTDGETMLHVAFRQNKYPLQIFLLNKGAIVTIVDTKNKLPYIDSNSIKQTKQNVHILEQYFISPLKSILSSKQCLARPARLCQDANNKTLSFVMCVSGEHIPQTMEILNGTFRNGVQMVVRRSNYTESKLLNVYENSKARQDKVAFKSTEDANSLFSQHSNLNMISVTSQKSIGFGREKHCIIIENCIALLCDHKGFIPVGELNFPSRIGDLKTDVREGYCCFASNELKLGETIKRARIGKSGSLGVFVDMSNGQKGIITCAHVLHTLDELRSRSYAKDESVLKVTESTEFVIGTIQEAVFTPNIPSEISVDAALVRLHSNIDIMGEFPDVVTYQRDHAGNV